MIPAPSWRTTSLANHDDLPVIHWQAPSASNFTSSSTVHSTSRDLAQIGGSSGASNTVLVTPREEKPDAESVHCTATTEIQLQCTRDFPLSRGNKLLSRRNSAVPP